MPSSRYALFIVATIVFSAGVTPIVIRVAQSEGIPSLVIVFIRLWIITASLFPIIWIRHREELLNLKPRQYIWGLIAGFWLAMNLFMLFLALEYTSVLVTSVLRRTSPLWIILPEVTFLGAVFSRRIWISLAVTGIGVLLVAFGGVSAIEPGSHPLLGAAMATFGALCFGIYLLIGRRLAAEIPSLLYSWLVFLGATIVASVLILVTHTPVTGYTRIAYFWTFVITILAQVMGHMMINLGLQYFTATAMGIILQMGVVVSAIMALFLFGEIPSTPQLIGSVFVVFGVILATMEQSKKQAKKSATP